MSLLFSLTACFFSSTRLFSFCFLGAGFRGGILGISRPSNGLFHLALPEPAPDPLKRNQTAPLGLVEPLKASGCRATSRTDSTTEPASWYLAKRQCRLAFSQRLIYDRIALLMGVVGSMAADGGRSQPCWKQVKAISSTDKARLSYNPISSGSA